MIKIIKEICPKDKQYRFAVSTGVDSVSAYFWMREKGYNVTPIHFNHKLREQNDFMEKKYIELCKATNVDPVLGAGNCLISENDCRKARLDFYKETVGYGETILTAHHSDDWVESYILNCFRGHPDHEPFNLVSDFESFHIAHPFLLCNKNDFIQYAERNNLLRFVVTDDTNNLVKGSRRNWIRSNIVPEMKNQKLGLEKYAKRRVQSLIENSILVN